MEQRVIWFWWGTPAGVKRFFVEEKYDFLKISWGPPVQNEIAYGVDKPMIVRLRVKFAVKLSYGELG